MWQYLTGCDSRYGRVTSPRSVLMSMGREPDPDMMSRLRGQAGLWRSAVEAANDERARLNDLVVEAKDMGHSFAQIREVTGFGIQTIQMILAKAGRL